LYTILIYLVVVGVTLGVEDIKPVFNVVGAICSTSIAILLPCFFYFRLIGIKEQPTSLIYYISIVLFCVMAPYAIFSILALYINPN
jgi:amino acid permease